jgi:nucleoside-diphosphate-sugar epimerase
MERLLADGWDVIGIDLPQLVSADGGGRCRGHDLTERLAPRSLEGVEVLIHAAALAGVLTSWARLHDYWRANAYATRLLRESCEQGGVPRIVHLSSISVYGEGEQLDETSPTMPLSPYGIFKLEAERAWDHYPGSSIVRLSNVYGPRQRPDMAYATFARAALLGHRIKLRDGGLQRRTPTYIDDCVDGIIAVATCGATPGIYNIAGPHDVQLLDVPRLLSELLGMPMPISIEPPVPGDPRVATVSSALAQCELGYRPVTGLRDGLVRQLDAMDEFGQPRASERQAAVGRPAFTT